MHYNAPGQILIFQNTSDIACDEIRLEIQSMQFLRRFNLIEFMVKEKVVVRLANIPRGGERGI